MTDVSEVDSSALRIPRSEQLSTPGVFIWQDQEREQSLETLSQAATDSTNESAPTSELQSPTLVPISEIEELMNRIEKRNNERYDTWLATQIGSQEEFDVRMRQQLSSSQQVREKMDYRVIKRLEEMEERNNRRVGEAIAKLIERQDEAEKRIKKEIQSLHDSHRARCKKIDERYFAHQAASAARIDAEKGTFEADSAKFINDLSAKMTKVYEETQRKQQVEFFAKMKKVYQETQQKRASKLRVEQWYNSIVQRVKRVRDVVTPDDCNSWISFLVVFLLVAIAFDAVSCVYASVLGLYSAMPQASTLSVGWFNSYWQLVRFVIIWTSRSVGLGYAIGVLMFWGDES